MFQNTCDCYYDDIKVQSDLESIIYFMQRRQQRTIARFVRIFDRQRTRSMPDRPAIRAYFKNLPKPEQKRLGKIDYSKNKANGPNHRCHVLGFAIGRVCFTWAVRQCNWIPNWKVINDLIKRVINFQGNFTICQGSYNIQRRDGGQATLLKILKNGDINNIRIPRGQAPQLLKILNGIRKRYYDLFFQRCIAFGVPEHVVEQIFLFLQAIHNKAVRVRYSQHGNYQESPFEDQEGDQDQQVPEDQGQRLSESSPPSLHEDPEDSAQREYDRDDPSYPGSCDQHSSC